MKTPTRCTLTALLLLGAATVHAQEPDRQARAWAASCAACHGTNGVSSVTLVTIAGVDKAQLLEKLQAFKNGTLPATVMHQHTKGYTDAELERLAAYFSRQTR